MAGKNRRINDRGVGELFLIGLFTYVLLASMLMVYLGEARYDGAKLKQVEYGEWQTYNTSARDFTVWDTCHNQTMYMVTAGEWNCTANGLESRNPIYNEVVINLLPGVVEDYVNHTYTLYNPSGVNYDIVIRDAKYICSNFLTCGLWSSLNDWMYLKATDDGWWRDEGILSGHYDAGTDVSAYTNPVINTTYNTKDGWGEAYYNGTMIFHDTHYESAQTPQLVYYGGVKAYGAGLAIQTIQSSSSISPPEVEWDNPLTVFALFAMVLTWNLPEVFGIPLWVNILFIKIPLIGLIWIMAKFFRGIS